MKIIEISTFSGELLEARCENYEATAPTILNMENGESFFVFGSTQKVYIRTNDLKNAVVRTIKEDF